MKERWSSCRIGSSIVNRSRISQDEDFMPMFLKFPSRNPVEIQIPSKILSCSSNERSMNMHRSLSRYSQKSQMQPILSTVLPSICLRRMKSSNESSENSSFHISSPTIRSSNNYRNPNVSAVTASTIPMSQRRITMVSSFHPMASR